MSLRWLCTAFVLALATSFPLYPAAAENTCPREGALGVSRTVEIDTTGGPGFGMEHYKAYDFLADKEVVLTFDDGPQKYTTEAVLKALSDECVKATFFSIGKMALGYPEIIREVAKAGNTIGTHTWSHKAIAKLKTFDEGKDEIERGISAVHRAVGGPVAPFFRFPTLVDTPEAIAYLGKRNISMFSADIDSFDFKPQTADHLVTSLMQKLDKRGKGILLMHDIHKTTAKALPALLAQLKAKGYKIVHLTAKNTVTTVPEYDAAIEKEAKGLPQVGAERPMSSIIKTVEGTQPAAEETSPSSGAEPDGLPMLAPGEAAAKALGATSPAAATSPEPAAAATPPSPPSSVPASPSTAPMTSPPGKQSSSAAPAAADEKHDAMLSASTPSVPVAASAVLAPTTVSAAEPMTTTFSAQPAMASSVVRTVSGSAAAAETKSAAGEPSAAETLPPAPKKSLTERAKETWELWFGQ